MQGGITRRQSCARLKLYEMSFKDMGKSANRQKTVKRRAPKSAWKPGQSGNPSGRPKNEVSLVHWFKEWGNMSSEEAAKLCKTYAGQLNQVKGDLPIAAVAALRVWMSVINDPTPGLIGHLLDRIDGAVVTKGELSISWRDKIREAGYDPDELFGSLIDAAQSRAHATAGRSGDGAESADNADA